MTGQLGEAGVVGLIGALLTGGAAKFIYDLVADWLRHRREQPTPEEESQARLDHSFLTVVRARDELAKDNSRLRTELREERDLRRQEKADWMTERESLKREIAALEAQVRAQRDEFNARTDTMLQTIHDLQSRAARMDG